MIEGPSARERLTFLVIAIAILFLIDQLVLNGSRPYLEEIGENAQEEQVIPDDELPEAPDTNNIPEKESPSELPHTEELPPNAEEDEDIIPDNEDIDSKEGQIREIGFSEVEDLKASIHTIDFSAPPVEPFVRFAPEPAEQTNPADPNSWEKHAVKVSIPKNMAKVVVILDDMGVNGLMSEAAIDLPSPLTLAFLPYARNGKSMAQRAAGRGHELMVHMPMEPLNSKLDPGPDVLNTKMTEQQLAGTLDKGLAVYKGYVGINNHMGSKLTQDAQAMARIMKELRKRGLLFVDSRTISTSVADETAAVFGVAHASRDVFLDHNSDYLSVMNSLKNLENIALKRGYAIAIGHPKKNTIRALYEWLPTLESKGIALVPVSAVVKKSSAGGVLEASMIKRPPRPE